MIKANVGDTIKVVFKNFASRPYSIHPRGVHYNKSYEGAWYNDGTKGKSLTQTFTLGFGLFSLSLPH